jgi:hypothetical protein
LNNSMIENLYQFWVNNNWLNVSRSSYTHDVHNNLLEELNQHWDGSNWENYWRITSNYIIVGIDQSEGDVNSYQLSNNYPNPFNPSTKIKYQIPERSFVTLKVYDVLGNEITTLVNEEKPAGNYEVEFNVGQDSSPDIASGIYFYQLKADNYVETKKMILLR